MKEITEQEFVEMIVKAIVDNPEDVKTEKTVDDRGTLVSLMLNPDDMGKIIGKGGRTVNSIRKLLHVFGAKTDERINLKIFEPDGGEVRMPSEDESTPEEIPTEAPPTPEPEKPQHDNNLDDVPTEVLV